MEPDDLTRTMIAESRALIAAWESDPSVEAALAHSMWAIGVVPLVLNVLEARLNLDTATRRPPLALPALADIQRYLTAHDWLPGNAGPIGTLWAKAGVRIGVPHELDEESVTGVLERLARAERRDIGAVLADIRQVQP
jgi:hypothetical protein